MVDLLVVGTHPDDIELGIGGSVAGWVRQGYDVAMLDLTNGEPTPFGDQKTRAREAAAAAKILGVKTRITLDLPNRELVDTIEARRKVAQVYRQLKPALLIIQTRLDSHPDHIEGQSIAQKARFDAKLTKTDMTGEPWYAKRIIRYLASHLPQVIEPTFILDVTKTFDKKIEVVKAYQSQFAAARREEWIIDKLELIGRYYGALIGVRYGEPFICEEPLGLSDIRDIIR